MSSEIDCLKYRNDYDDLSTRALPDDVAQSLHNHGLICVSCMKWRAQMDDLVSRASHFPQFDVPEQLTQRILAQIRPSNNATEAGRYALVVPMTVCLFGLVAVLPIDSIEGLMSTGLSLGGLYLVKMLVSGVKPEELVA